MGGNLDWFLVSPCVGKNFGTKATVEQNTILALDHTPITLTIPKATDISLGKSFCRPTPVMAVIKGGHYETSDRNKGIDDLWDEWTSTSEKWLLKQGIDLPEKLVAGRGSNPRLVDNTLSSPQSDGIAVGKRDRDILRLYKWVARYRTLEASPNPTIEAKEEMVSLCEKLNTG